MFELLSVQVMVMLLLGACWGNGVVKRSDDVTPVEIVVQQQAMTIQSLQAHLSTLQQSVASLTSRLASVETEIQQGTQSMSCEGVLLAVHGCLLFSPKYADPPLCVCVCVCVCARARARLCVCVSVCVEEWS